MCQRPKTPVREGDDGPKARRRQWLCEARRRVAAGEVPSLSVPLKTVKSEGNRRDNKVILRLNPKTTLALRTYNNLDREKKKPKPMAFPAAAG